MVDIKARLAQHESAGRIITQIAVLSVPHMVSFAPEPPRHDASWRRLGFLYGQCRIFPPEPPSKAVASLTGAVTETSWAQTNTGGHNGNAVIFPAGGRGAGQQQERRLERREHFGVVAPEKV